MNAIQYLFAILRSIKFMTNGPEGKKLLHTNAYLSSALEFYPLLKVKSSKVVKRKWDRIQQHKCFCSCIFTDCVTQTLVVILVNFWIPTWIHDGILLEVLNKMQIFKKKKKKKPRVSQNTLKHTLVSIFKKKNLG